MDVWSQLTLGDVFPGPAERLGELQGKLSALSARLDALAGKVNAKFDAANGLLSTTGGLIDAMGAAGFYTCTLPPAAGGWSSRLQGASGAPPNTGVSAGLVVLVQGPDLEAVAAQYAQLASILAAPI